MYSLINSHVEQILHQIREREENHVTDYDWLIEHLHEVATPEYQRKYRYYWGLNAAFLSEEYCHAYFGRLEAGLQHGVPALSKLITELYEVPSNATETHRLQFSFCSKLCHMLDRHMPIYDSRVRDFYFFTVPGSRQSVQKRISRFIDFHRFLVREYHRVLTNELLVSSIQLFRQEFNSQYFTDEKIVDSLIRHFVGLLNQGALMKEEIIYH